MKRLTRSDRHDLDRLRHSFDIVLGNAPAEETPGREGLLALHKSLEVMEIARETDDPFELLSLNRSVGLAEIELLLRIYPPPEERVELLRSFAIVLERWIGEEVFRLLRRECWTFPPTRRYILVRHMLAEALFVLGKPDEALAEWEAVHALVSHNDSGARLGMLPCAIALGREELVRKLFAAYKDTVHKEGVFAWCRVLERWSHRDLKAAKKALETARAINPHVEAYLAGIRKESFDPMADRLEPGTATEAKTFAPLLLYAWQSYPGAFAWLREEPRGPWHRRAPQRTLDPRRWAVPKEEANETENGNAKDAAGGEKDWTGEDFEAWMPQKG